MSITNPTPRNWNSFMGGLSDDSYVVAQGQYPYGFGVDIRRFPRFAQLQRKQSATVGTLGLGQSAILTSMGNLFICDDGGYVTYYSGSPSGTVVWTSPRNVALYEMAEFQGNIYLFGNNAIYWIPLASAGTTAASWNGLTTTIATNSANLTRYSVNYLNAKLYFTEDAKLRYFDKLTPTTPQDANFTGDTHIVGLTMHSTSLWLYCSSGKQYAYDIGNDVVIGVKDWQETLQFVKQLPDYDLTVTGVNSYYSNLWQNSGVQPGSNQIIKRTKYDPTINQIYGVDTVFGFSAGTSGSQQGGTARGVTYLWGRHESNYVVYGYGKKGDGYPNSATVEYTLNYAGNPITAAGCICRFSTGFLYAWRSGASTYGVDFVDTSSPTPTNGYVSTGEILLPWDDTAISETFKDQTDDLDLKKEISYIRVGGIIPTGCTLDFYYLLDGDGGAGTLYKSFGPSDAVGYSFRIDTNIAPFGRIAWRIVLNGNGTSTPQLFNHKYILHPQRDS